MRWRSRQFGRQSTEICSFSQHQTGLGEPPAWCNPVSAELRQGWEWLTILTCFSHQILHLMSAQHKGTSWCAARTRYTHPFITFHLVKRNLAKSVWAAAARGMTVSYGLASSSPPWYFVLERSSLLTLSHESCVCIPAYFSYLNMHFVLKDFINPWID